MLFRNFASLSFHIIDQTKDALCGLQSRTCHFRVISMFERIIAMQDPDTIGQIIIQRPNQAEFFLPNDCHEYVTITAKPRWRKTNPSLTVSIPISKQTIHDMHNFPPSITGYFRATY